MVAERMRAQELDPVSLTTNFAMGVSSSEARVVLNEIKQEVTTRVCHCPRPCGFGREG